MNMSIPDGVYPTMLTPFTEDNRVDYRALEQLIAWYYERGVRGLFAICQSSEIFFLSFEERLEILRFVMAHKPKDVTVVASGHTADDPAEQIEQAKRLIDTGIDAYVLISNRLAKENESDDVYLSHMEDFLRELPEIPLGVYECPYPYKRLLSERVLSEMAKSGRFCFIKDTCCDLDRIRRRLAVTKGSGIKIFNANCATVLDSVAMGCAGFSGVMANFHPEIYVQMLACRKTDPQRAALLQNFAGFASMAECQVYPVNAKYYLSLDGLAITTHTRSRSDAELTASRRKEIQQMYEFTRDFEKQIGLSVPVIL